jgi:transcriptional regulator with XRE-family HTH domain
MAEAKPGKNKRHQGQITSSENQPSVAVYEEVSVAQRLREIRASRKLSLRALAKLSGLNANTLSLIENEHTSPSVSTLQEIAQGLGVHISEFFQSNHGNKTLVFQKKGTRPRLIFDNSTLEDLASGMPRFGAEPIIVTLEPGADSGKQAIVHTGREFVYCLKGQIAYTVDGENYILDVGDSLFFEAYLPHQWKNTDTRSSQAVLVLIPTDGRDHPKERHFIL